MVPKQKKQFFRNKRARFLGAFAALLVAVWISGVRLFAFPGESMSPEVRPGDHFVGMVGVWGLRAPKRFEMVIFDPPPSSKWAGRGIPWMKRLVGLPGEHVRLSRDKLFINGRNVEAPFLRLDNPARESPDFQIKLGQDEYCVLGDNLDHSFDDSRTMGPIARSLIKGRAAFVIRSSTKSGSVGPDDQPKSRLGIPPRDERK